MQKSEFSYFYPLRVRYAEVDMQGVVFNAHYLTYCDTGITEFMRALDYDYSVASVQATGEDFHLVKSLVEYKGPIYFDDEIEVGVRAGRIGRTSITWEIGIFRKGEEKLLAACEVVWVHVLLADHRPIPLPAALIEAVGGNESA